MRFEHLPDLEIQKNDIIHFQDGMLGFEEYKDFVMYQQFVSEWYYEFK